MNIDLEEKFADADKLAAETLYEYKTLDELKLPQTEFKVDIVDLFKITIREVLSTPDDDVIMNVPVSLGLLTTKNKVRLISNDKNSPLGLVIKDPSVYKLLKVYYAIGQFKAEDILKWIRVYHPEIVEQVMKETQKK